MDRNEGPGDFIKEFGEIRIELASGKILSRSWD
jgi:hypothetical protein